MNPSIVSVVGDGALSEPVRSLVAESRSANTRKGYLSDWTHFAEWCREQGRESLPASPQTIAEYVAEHELTFAYATLKRRVSSISSAHHMAGFESPCRSELVGSVLKGVARSRGTAQTKKSALRLNDLREAFGQAPETPRDVRNRALVLLGYAGGFRRGELVALSVKDIEFVPEGMVVNVRRSKTDQGGKGFRKGIPFGQNERTCPVKAVIAWMELRPLKGPDSPVFLRFLRDGKVSRDRLTAQSVALILKELAGKIGIDVSRVAGHSIRSGFITDAFASGASEGAIMANTGHRSTSVLTGYRREANLFKNANSGVGL